MALKNSSYFKTGAVGLGKNTVPTAREKWNVPTETEFGMLFYPGEQITSKAVSCKRKNNAKF